MKRPEGLAERQRERKNDGKTEKTEKETKAWGFDRETGHSKT